MLGAPALRIHTITTGVVCCDQANTSSRLCCQFLNLRRILNQQLHQFIRRRRGSRSSNLCLAVIYCNTNKSDYNSHHQDAGHDFILASLLLSGEFAVQKLIESSQEDDNGDYPKHFQLVRHIVGKLGYEVKLIKITERVVNTYFAGIYFQKPGKSEILRVDARPSDAINVAQRCKVPIYVNKQVVLNDAIKIDYGGRIRDTKSIYDVTLDSTEDGPDLLLEELDMVKNMNLAVKQERYSEAAMWRDKLMKRRYLRNEH